MSLLGELRRKRVPCPLVGAQQIHRDATLWAHCVPGHPRAAWTTSHFFSVSPLQNPSLELSIPSAPLPFLREALEVPQALSDRSIPPHRLAAFSLGFSKLQSPCTACSSPTAGSLGLCPPLPSIPVSLEALPAPAGGLMFCAFPPWFPLWPPLGSLSHQTLHTVGRSWIPWQIFLPLACLRARHTDGLSH